MGRKVYFRYGTMGSGKSLDMIRAIFNYQERGMRVLVYKSAVDTRDGGVECAIISRAGFRVEGKWLPKDKSIYSLIVADIFESEKLPKAIFVDEAQFLTEEQVDELQKICYNFNIPVLCYGLLVDFQRHLFTGSKRLIEIADDKLELIGICHCGRRAKQNARVVNGEMVTEGEVVKIGGNESYIAVCNECYVRQNIGGIK